jgi:hypothetical protein
MIDLSALGLTSEVVSTANMYVTEGSDDRVLLYDGDAACYVHTAGVKGIQTAQNRLEKDILTMMYLAKCSSARVHLTPKGCLKNNRHLLLGVNPYQYNRGASKKPMLLELLRDTAPQYFQDHPDIQVFGHYDIEADDALMIDTFSMSNGVLISADKDLLISPKEQYFPDTGEFIALAPDDRFGWIKRKEWMTSSGKLKAKCVGKGSKFFLAQMLMGDAADGVKGLLKLNGKLCGYAGTLAALEHIECEHDAVNTVLDGYRVLDQNPIPESEAMWLLRHRDDNSYKYFTEQELTTENQQFLDDCWFNRKWALTQEDYDDMTEEHYAKLFRT